VYFYVVLDIPGQSSSYCPSLTKIESKGVHPKMIPTVTKVSKTPETNKKHFLPSEMGSCFTMLFFFEVICWLIYYFLLVVYSCAVLFLFLLFLADIQGECSSRKDEKIGGIPKGD
jgi:hypothetical protein